MQLEGCVLTHEGNIRSKNEDNFLLFGAYKELTSEKCAEEKSTITAKEAVAAVFDGMGGEAAGEVASLIAAKTLVPCGREQVETVPILQIRVANDRICDEIRKCGRRMGATATALYFTDGLVTTVSIGDSRAYLFRDGLLTQLTVDHSEGQRMVEMGLATEREARRLTAWHTLTQHLGIFPEEFVIEPCMTPTFPIQKGDLFLLCSDGLCDLLYNEQIEEFLREHREEAPETEAEGLLDAALKAGGLDNVTVMLVKVLNENAQEGS